MRQPWTVGAAVGVVLLGSALTLGAEQPSIAADCFKNQTARLKAYFDAYEAVEKTDPGRHSPAVADRVTAGRPRSRGPRRSTRLPETRETRGLRQDVVLGLPEIVLDCACGRADRW